MNVEMKTGVYILNFLEFRGQYKSGLPFNLEPNSGHYIKNLLVKKCSLEHHNTPNQVFPNFKSNLCPNHFSLKHPKPKYL